METKTCTGCNRTLSATSFYKRSDSATRLSSECRECKTVRSAKRYREHTARHAMLVKRRYDTHGRFARYGLSVESYDAMLAKQGNQCALCKAEKPGGKGKWHIDHEGGIVKTFKQCGAESVRGLLCHRCNVSLGHYEKLLRRVGEDSISRYIMKR